MPKQMSGKTFSNLLDYYIACLEQEDMLSVTFELSSEGSQFLSTPFQNEVLFHTDNQQMTAEQSAVVKRFFQTSLLQQKNKSLFYGYPIMVFPGGTMSPVFFTELQFEQLDDTIIYTKVAPKPTMNHYLLTQQGISPEEILNIQHEIEDEEFTSALASLCTVLQVKDIKISPTLDRKPITRTITPKLVNKAILYFGERTDITHNLIMELHQLKKKPLDDLASSTLLFLLTNEVPVERTLSSGKPLLEVFSLNPSQEYAVQSTLSKPLTVITGPPGTGKSQVVLNIIANAVYQNKTVLFASKNNKAVDVVIEKLHAILPYKLIVRMGHRDHRRAAKAELDSLFTQHLQMTTIRTPEKTVTDLLQVASEIQWMQNELTSMSSLNQSIENIQTTIDTLREQLPLEFVTQINDAREHKIDTWQLKQDIKKVVNHHGFHTKLFKKVSPEHYRKNLEHCFRTYSEHLPSLLKTYVEKTVNDTSSMGTALQWILQYKELQQAQDELLSVQNQLLSFPPYAELKNHLNTMHEERRAISRPLFEHYWLTKLIQTTSQDRECVTDYFSASEQLESWVGDQIVFRQLLSKQIRTLQKILKFLPVWVVTNLSAKHSFPLKNNLFDLLIIDEASQCDIASALPLFYRVKHVAIIGDPNQLKHISLLNETQDRTLAAHCNLNEDVFTRFSYTKHSLYALAECIATENNEHPILLNEHYRCHPDIISFSNDYYYSRKLTIATDETRLLQHPSLSTRVMWVNVKGKTVHAKSPYNEEEAERVVEEILKLLVTIRETQTPDASIGVVTLFRAQTEMIAQKLTVFQPVYETDITVGTAHRFQGDEKDIIVFSPAVSEGVKPGTLHWIQTTRQLLNVAVTRARSLLIIVGDQDRCAETTGPLKELVDYVDSKNISNHVFDSHSKQLLFEELKKYDIRVTPHYWINGKPSYRLDLALFANGSRYAIEIQDVTSYVPGRDSELRADGWKIRRFLASDIHQKLTDVIETLKRLC